MEKASKTVVIGLDGAPFPLIEQWAQQGKLPNLAKLIERGSFGILNSTIPIHSPTAWTSFITGVNPGKHGVFDFVRRASDSYQLRVVRSNHIVGQSLWQLLSDAGHTVGVMNVPMTYPPEPVNGYLITGLGTPKYEPYTYPDELTDKLNAQGYRVNKDFFYELGRDDEWLADMHAISDIHGEAAVQFLTEDQPDFFMVVFRNSDEICHFFWRHMDETHPEHDPDAPAHYKTAIQDLYQRLDHWIGRIIDTADENSNIIIMSDHGAGPLYRDVFLNEWLLQKEWLQLAPPQTGSGLARRFGVTRKNISDALTKLRLHRVEVLIKKILGDRIQVLPRDERPEFVNAVDWSKTVAYSFGYYGQIFINLRGREPYGIVDVADYEMLRADIVEELKQLVDPVDGEPVVDQVLLKEELYSGQSLELAPDIVCVMRDYTYITRKGYEFAERRGTLFSSPYTNESGSHRREGIIIAAGPEIEADKKLPPADIQDLTPTILYLHGCAIPAYMDGAIIDSLLPNGFVEQHQPTYDGTKQLKARSESEARWDDGLEQELVEQLQKLGYLN